VLVHPPPLDPTGTDGEEVGVDDRLRPERPVEVDHLGERAPVVYQRRQALDHDALDLGRERPSGPVDDRGVREHSISEAGRAVVRWVHG